MENLSVVVPVYNVYPYLRECLDSIINQTYKNLEIIIVNDASPYKEDDEICREYVRKDERIKYIIHNKNKGLGGARNTGIDNATGKYITFIDSDDYLCDNNIYENIMLKFKNLNVDVIGYGVELYIEEENKFIDYKYTNSYKNKKITKMNIENSTDIVCNKVYKLESIKSKNIRFREHFIHEDTDFTIKFIELVEPTYLYVDTNAYIYRERKGSTITSITNIDIRFKSLMVIYEWLIEHNMDKKYELFFFDIIKYNLKNNVTEKQSKEMVKFGIFLINRMDLNKINYDDIDLYFFTYFIENKQIQLLYKNKIEIYKKFKYKAVVPNIHIYKIKREIKRIINQIKGIFVKRK